MALDDLIRSTIQAATEIWLTSVFWQAGLMMMAGVVLMVLGFLAGMWRTE